MYGSRFYYDDAVIIIIVFNFIFIVNDDDDIALCVTTHTHSVKMCIRMSEKCTLLHAFYLSFLFLYFCFIFHLSSIKVIATRLRVTLVFFLLFLFYLFCSSFCCACVLLLCVAGATLIHTYTCAISISRLAFLFDCMTGLLVSDANCCIHSFKHMFVFLSSFSCHFDFFYSLFFSFYRLDVLNRRTWHIVGSHK